MATGYNLGAMQQVVPLLWIGNISAAYDIDTLRKNGIHSVVSVVNGDVEVHPTFYRHHIHLDDIEDADILSVLPAAVAFIEKEIEIGRGVLVHCLAGVSRSATVTAAYLMYSKNIDAATAIEMIRAVRPQVGPNEGFLEQLDLFHGAAHKLSLQDKATRMYYLEQAVKRIKSGQQVSLTDISGTIDLKTQSGRQRRIRCKMCRQELAGRENMLGHKISPVELPPPEPVTESPPPPVTIAPGPSVTPGSRRNSNNTKLPPAGLTELAGLTMSSISDESAIDDDDLPPPPSPSAAKLLADRHRRASMDQQGANLKTASERLAQQLSDAVTLGEELSREPNSSQSSTTSAPLTDSTSDRRVALPDMSASHPLADPACSGYFLEPMNWMTPFLESGEISGKLLCPNKRCKAKVGNFAWTGAHCSCGDWVVPGICIARGKVDEITI